MSTEPSINENESTPSFQRIAIAIGTVIIVVLTVVAALFLAMQDLPDSTEPPAIVEASPSPTTPATIVTFTPSPTVTPLPTQTPSATPTSPPPLPTATPSLPPPTVMSTNTPLPPPSPSPTFTLTPITVVASPTPLPAPPVTESPPLPTEGACQPPPSWVTYVVQPGDSLDTLAARTDTSVFELQQVNCLASFTLKVGQTIYLPFIPPTPTITYTPSPTGTRGPTPTRTATPISPQIESVIPNRVDLDTASEIVIITVLGRNFAPNRLGFKVELTGPAGVELELGNTYSSTSFNAIVPAGLPEGTYSLVVTNPDDRAGIRSSAYTIGPASPTDTPSPPPDITRFTPASGNISEEITLTVQGVNFKPNQSGFKVELQSTSSSFRVELDLGGTRTDTNFTAIIRPDILDPGSYNLVVINPDGRTDIASSIYQAF